MKKQVIILLVVVVVGIGIYLLSSSSKPKPKPTAVEKENGEVTVTDSGGALASGEVVTESDVAGDDSGTAIFDIDSGTASGTADSDTSVSEPPPKQKQKMVKSVELHEIPPHGGASSDGGDGVMNIKEIQLWRRTPSGVTNVARSGLAKLLQGIADRYFTAAGPQNNNSPWAGINKINNGVVNDKGFLFTTIPIGKTSWNDITYAKAAEYPIVRITLSTAVPMDEIVSAVIWNRSDGAQGRLGKDLLVLRGDDGKVVSQIQLPKASMMKNYVRVDYKRVNPDEETDERSESSKNKYIVRGLNVAAFMADGRSTTITPKYIQ